MFSGKYLNKEKKNKQTGSMLSLTYETKNKKTNKLEVCYI